MTSDLVPVVRRVLIDALCPRCGSDREVGDAVLVADRHARQIARELAPRRKAAR